MSKRANASSEVLRLKTLQKMADKSQTLQRYPASDGTLGAWTLRAQTCLTHGTPAQQFLDPGGNRQALPDPPAWFAIGSRFAAHAGSRHDGPVTYLHNYDVRANTNLLAFANVSDISLYLQANGFNETDRNGVSEAGHIFTLNPRASGYYVHSDAVRQEPEIVLFQAGMANLVPLFKSQLEHEQSPEFRDDMAPLSRLKLKGGGRVQHTANEHDIKDFRTIGDHQDGTARARSI